MTDTEPGSNGTTARETDDVTRIAHRGFAGRYPENTIGAVEAACGTSPGIGPQAPVDMIEIDVLPTADGTVVVFHDDDLGGRDGGTRGLTDRSGTVWETETETVTSASVLGTWETVPTLEELLAAVPADVGVNVEFKNPGDGNLAFARSLPEAELSTREDIWRPFTERVLGILAEFDNDVLVSSFYEAALSTVRELDSSIPLAFLFWDDVRTGLEITRTYDCEAVHLPRNMVTGTPFFNDEYYVDGGFDDIDLVGLAHDEGRTVNVWTVETWYQAQQLAAAGVDGLIANYPGLLAFEG